MKKRPPSALLWAPAAVSSSDRFLVESIFAGDDRRDRRTGACSVGIRRSLVRLSPPDTPRIEGAGIRRVSCFSSLLLLPSERESSLA